MADETVYDPPMSGKIPYVMGQVSVVRIPVPGPGNLCIEFRPRGPIPRSGSTSTLFFQDPTGKRHLRLDYGKNPATKTIDYHWNQQGVYRNFGIPNHSPVGRVGATAYEAARAFRYVGRSLVVVGVAIDVVSVVQATRPLRRASEVVAGWAGAWIGCKGVGAGGAALGTAVTPGFGTVAGGVVGCVIGGFGGYLAGSTIAGGVYDWADDTLFFPLPEARAH